MFSTLSIWVFDCSVYFCRGPWMMIFLAMVIHQKDCRPRWAFANCISDSLWVYSPPHMVMVILIVLSISQDVLGWWYSRPWSSTSIHRKDCCPRMSICQYCIWLFSYSSPQKQLWRTRSKCRPDQFWIHILTLSAIWRENSLYMLKLFIVTSLEEGLKGLSLILNSKITLPLAGASIKGGQGGNYQPRFCQNWWRL